MLSRFKVHHGCSRSISSKLRVILIFAFLWFGNLWAALYSYTGSLSSIQNQINAAISSQATSVTLTPGVYQLVDTSLVVDGAEGLEIIAESVTLVMSSTTFSSSPVVIENCQDLRMSGFTIDYDPLPYTQGTITSIGTSGYHYYYTHDGYPELTSTYLVPRAYIAHPSLNQFKDGVPDMYLSAHEQIDARHGKFKFGSQPAGAILPAVGDRVVFNVRKAAAVSISRSEDVVIEDATILASSGLAFISRFMSGSGNVFRGCKVIPGPRPVGAGHERLLSSNADGINYAYVEAGPVIQDCEFDRLGDDAINLHGMVAPVVDILDSNTVLVGRPDGTAFDDTVSGGDEIRFLEPVTYAIAHSATVSTWTKIGAATPGSAYYNAIREAWPGSSGTATLYQATLTTALPGGIAASYFADFPDSCGKGFVIRDNVISEIRSRGFRIMASDGLIINNTFSRIRQAAISLGPEYTSWREAGWVDNVKVLHNQMQDIQIGGTSLAGSCYNLGAISLAFRPDVYPSPTSSAVFPKCNTNLVIANNSVVNCGLSGLHLWFGDGMHLSNNELVNTNLFSGTGAGSSYGMNADDVVSYEQGIDPTEYVLVDPTASWNYTPDGSANAPYQSIGRAFQGRTDEVDEIRMLPGETLSLGTLIVQDTLTVRGVSGPNGEKPIVTSSSPYSDFQKVGGTQYVYSRALSSTRNCLWQNNWVDGAGHWRGLVSVADLSSCDQTPGSFFWQNGMVYVHTFDSSSPNGVIEIPSASYCFYATNGGTLVLDNVQLRGARSNGLYAKSSGTLVLSDCLLTNNCYNGVGTSAAVMDNLVMIDDCISQSNFNDGYGFHGGDNLVYISDSEASYNQDDGTSPHDGCELRLSNVHIHHNNDRGAVAVGGSTMTISDCTITDNGGQNVSYEGTGTTGVMRDSLLARPGTGQPNMRIIDGQVLMHDIVDETGSPVVPALYGTGSYTVE